MLNENIQHSGYKIQISQEEEGYCVKIISLLGEKSIVLDGFFHVCDTKIDAQHYVRKVISIILKHRTLTAYIHDLAEQSYTSKRKSAKFLKMYGQIYKVICPIGFQELNRLTN
ncbi:hypothetical protein ERICIV_04589 (plasmid) [Paenibacillus larvae subsp. larvae]|uniref:Uncharacterized protein n=1 Tax=Paenibacillus larvae subsp. larvae TaxID=147375 RepID=A0A2L1U7S4_9BACL|nr:hypothetical protein [Paenibacillus larvae]AQT86983.1 hypothetical protein B1222_23400 [Paenibacillus larvae subsp. pulvifaciens]AQZ49315.1 hypothetical protein B5S25_22705 [Paenibacillus larvae subsp. pulvifaciens]AVF28971.1 hypothetical protein ERICIII_04970 [Paenibacillus larvae subsp. larvae]AVF33352.1 hypothetical protein ERICIV_04589 [Paenibacillus larvae subsp. larvae]MBH0341596.1 hypothetical protein [Paenibacillus larvae]